ERETGIAVAPMIGAGSLRFRGGLSPSTVDEFLKTYPGLHTVTLQSSFRYDHPLEEVKKAIAKLNRKLGSTEPVLYSAPELERLFRLDELFVNYYRKTIEGTETFINQLARFIPARRERLQHTGHFGYSRRVGKAGLNLPRAITFTAVFYSVGIPPELIGMGRGLRDSRKEGLLPALEGFFPELPEVIRRVGRYFNRENLDLLAKRMPHFAYVRGGLEHIEAYLGEKLGPQEPDEIIHRNYSSNVLQNWLQGRSPEEDIVKAAQVRRSLG
ncbi:MAG TPA: phosphoenolpyruvate carboxylase, partial [bacterium]|nr:phosphoenolpyruvate carboxylase [bacterium]